MYANTHSRILWFNNYRYLNRSHQTSQNSLPSPFHGLGGPARVKILHLLLDGDKNVKELADLVGSPQGMIYSHLSCLRLCGYVIS
ncbi:winged helix-turn-helix transcriptional regulator [SAR202 cluster bacterium AC-647-N09_OGT_505m]|nr:winged helix-turn-helix transcriptional regulator [SAR202 cluster bacterium AC-647-N09_OGT_505m]